MTEEELRDLNPWAKFLEKNELKLYFEGGKQCCKGDLKPLETINDDLRKSKAKDAKQGIYQLELPPCPWDGNPLKANVIFLTLNPGYVEPFNKHFSKLVASNANLNKRVLKFRKKTLLLEADLRPTETEDEEPISTFDAVEIMDDIYWTNKFKHLVETLQKEQAEYKIEDFWKKVSVLQYIAYTSETFKKPEIPKTSKEDEIKPLPSQGFTKELIEFRLEKAQNDKEPLLLVVMRSKDKWEWLLGKEIFEKYKEHFIFRKKVTITRKNGTTTEQNPRGQYITENSFENGKDDWDKIIKALKIQKNESK